MRSTTFVLPRLRLHHITPRWDRRSPPAYAALAGFGILAVTAGTIAGFTLPDPTFLYGVAGLVAFFLFEATMLRRAGWERTSTAIETVILSLLLGFSTSLALVPLTAFSGPMADHLLIQIDRSLGFDWLSWYRSVSAYPWAMDGLQIAYDSFMPQGAGILILLCIYGKLDRAWHLVTATALGLWMTAILYPFVPAVAAYHHFGIASTDQFATIIQEIRDGNRIFSGEKIGGLVTFPSFHVTAAFLVAWAAWPLRHFRWPLIIANIIVAVSAIIIGAHYLIDVIGGLLVGVVAVWLSAGRLRTFPITAAARENCAPELIL